VSAEENTRLVQSAYEAFGQGDMAAFAEVMADDIEWVDPGDPDDDPNAGTFKGKEAVLGWLGGLALTLDYTTFEPREFIAQNDQGRIPGVLRGNGSGHRPRVCQSRGTRVDDPGWEARPIPELSRHRSGGCCPPRGVALRGYRRIVKALAWASVLSLERQSGIKTTLWLGAGPSRECSGMSLEGGGGLGRRHRARRDRDQVGDDFIERSAGIQLMRAARSERRLDPGEVIQDHRSFHRSLPVVARRSARDPVKDHVSRGAEQDDRVETVVELRPVPHAPFNEERATIIGVQQPGDPFLDPEPLPAAHFVGGLNILAILAPARIIGVYDAIAASAKFGERRRLARSRHAGHPTG
jgi:ketosteroid isomerase-like protein